MTIKQLKEKITTNTLDDSPLILKYSDNKFLCHQYVNEICRSKNLEKRYIESINETLDADIFDDNSNILYVIETEKFQEYPDEDFKNLVVICKSLPENNKIDYIEMPKPVNWQIEDYVKYRVPGLDEKEITWLCSICKYDIYRLNMECKKLEIFPEGSQKEIFRRINTDNGYSDLSDLNIFNFTDAIIKRNLVDVGKMLPDLEVLDLEPLGVVTIMLKKFKQILAIQTNSSSYLKSLNMSDKQVWFLKNNQCGIYTNDKLMENINFLTSIDYKLKTGNLDLNRENLLSYIVTQVI